MNSILLHYIHFPKNLLSKDFIDKIIKKLTNVKNSIVHLTIGRYYLNREKVCLKMFCWEKKNINFIRFRIIKKLKYILLAERNMVTLTVHCSY